MAGVLQTLSSIGRETAKIVLHAPCVVCDRELPWRARTASCCANCWTSLRKITSGRCTSCALPLAAGDGLRCMDCLVDPLPMDWTEAWGHYGGALERVLHALKFRRHDFFADPLAALMHETLGERLTDTPFDAVVPIPMHRAKLRRRGYNQAELLARSLASRLRVRPAPELLERTGERATQSRLSRAERRANVRGAFAASRRAAGKSILLVDDVCTTGETLRACAAALLQQDAARVCAVVVARA
jgi:ComF family protein